jgi:hypothetical protein
VVFIEHDMDIIRRYAPRVVALYGAGSFLMARLVAPLATRP